MKKFIFYILFFNFINFLSLFAQGANNNYISDKTIGIGIGFYCPVAGDGFNYNIPSGIGGEITYIGSFSKSKSESLGIKWGYRGTFSYHKVDFLNDKTKTVYGFLNDWWVEELHYDGPEKYLSSSICLDFFLLPFEKSDGNYRKQNGGFHFFAGLGFSSVTSPSGTGKVIQWSPGVRPPDDNWESVTSSTIFYKFGTEWVFDIGKSINLGLTGDLLLFPGAGKNQSNPNGELLPFGSVKILVQSYF